eukprot:g166.t1
MGLDLPTFLRRTALYPFGQKRVDTCKVMTRLPQLLQQKYGYSTTTISQASYDGPKSSQSDEIAYFARATATSRERKLWYKFPDPILIPSDSEKNNEDHDDEGLSSHLPDIGIHGSSTTTNETLEGFRNSPMGRLCRLGFAFPSQFFVHSSLGAVLPTLGRLLGSKKPFVPTPSVDFQIKSSILRITDHLLRSYIIHVNPFNDDEEKNNTLTSRNSFPSSTGAAKSRGNTTATRRVGLRDGILALKHVAPFIDTINSLYHNCLLKQSKILRKYENEWIVLLLRQALDILILDAETKEKKNGQQNPIKQDNKLYIAVTAGWHHIMRDLALLSQKPSNNLLAFMETLCYATVHLLRLESNDNNIIRSEDEPKESDQHETTNGLSTLFYRVMGITLKHPTWWSSSSQDSSGLSQDSSGHSQDHLGKHNNNHVKGGSHPSPKISRCFKIPHFVLAAFVTVIHQHLLILERRIIILMKNDKNQNGNMSDSESMVETAVAQKTMVMNAGYEILLQWGLPLIENYLTASTGMSEEGYTGMSEEGYVRMNITTKIELEKHLVFIALLTRVWRLGLAMGRSATSQNQSTDELQQEKRNQYNSRAVTLHRDLRSRLQATEKKWKCRYDILQQQKPQPANNVVSFSDTCANLEEKLCLLAIASFPRTPPSSSSISTPCTSCGSGSSGSSSFTLFSASYPSFCGSTHSDLTALYIPWFAHTIRNQSFVTSLLSLDEYQRSRDAQRERHGGEEGHQFKLKNGSTGIKDYQEKGCLFQAVIQVRWLLPGDESIYHRLLREIFKLPSELLRFYCSLPLPLPRRWLLLPLEELDEPLVVEESGSISEENGSISEGSGRIAEGSDPKRDQSKQSKREAEGMSIHSSMKASLFYWIMEQEEPQNKCGLKGTTTERSDEDYCESILLEKVVGSERLCFTLLQFLANTSTPFLVDQLYPETRPALQRFFQIASRADGQKLMVCFGTSIVQNVVQKVISRWKVNLWGHESIGKILKLFLNTRLHEIVQDALKAVKIV